MDLFIEPATLEKKAFMKNDSLLINNICNINKDIEYNLYLINDTLNNGLINNTEVLIDELFITLKISKIYIKDIDINNFNNVFSFYNVDVYSLL